MIVDMVSAILLIFIIAFLFDISFNLRRSNKDFDRLIRKLSEITDLIQKKI